jgi:general secretion pathway protein L
MATKLTNIVKRFYAWWLHELANALTPRRAAMRGWRTLARHTPEGMEIAARPGPSIEPIAVLAPDAPPDRIAAMRHRLSQLGAGGEVLLRLSPSDVVSRTIQIPSAASDVIEPVLRNQMDRIVPWPQEETCYGYRNLGPNAAAPGQLDIEIVATTRSILNGAMQRARALELIPYAVDFAADPFAEGVGIELLSLTPDPVARTARTLQTGLAVLLVCTLAVGAFGLYHMWGRQVASDELQSKIALARTRVAEVKRLNEENLEFRRQRERLVRRKREEPPMMLQIEALSRALPDTAYLIELEIHGREARLMGKSDDPTSLITMLEDTPQFEGVHFSAPTTREQGETAGTFSILARAQGAPEPDKEP